MDCESSIHDRLERMLLDARPEPIDLPLSFLKAITNDFSDDQHIGKGGFAVVYKGQLQNGTLVAVKKLSQGVEMDEDKFIKEVDCLMRVKHRNIVRFLGYCADTQGKCLKYEGKNVMAEERERLLCFEFLPNKSLDKYINDASQELEWRTRYRIIKGICEGLHYLHQEFILHLDLKPANILLNKDMVPKIADFGLSRCFDENKSQTITAQAAGTLGYMAPELLHDRRITFKSDIYSLGIIILEILTGQRYSAIGDVTSLNNHSKVNA
uniref:Protein kinase domain-containing protein n=1 Tax=Setaria italica TaxID=4555 RepID=K3ZME3_SETIT